MVKTQPGQNPATLGVFRNRDYRPPVLVTKSQRGLDCAHDRNRLQKRLQLRLEIGKKLAVVVLSNNADDTGNFTIQLGNVRTNRAWQLPSVEAFQVAGASESRYYLPSTDSISATAASNVAGLGAVASRHILESVSQSPPNAMSSS